MKEIYRETVVDIGEFGDDWSQIPASIVEGFHKLGKGKRES